MMEQKESAIRGRVPLSEQPIPYRDAWQSVIHMDKSNCCDYKSVVPIKVQTFSNVEFILEYVSKRGSDVVISVWSFVSANHAEQVANEIMEENNVNGKWFDSYKWGKYGMSLI